MKKIFTLQVVFLIFLISGLLSSQERLNQGKSEQTFDSVFTWRLIDEMNLSEQQQSSFLAKFKESRQIMKQQRQRRKEILEQLAELLKEKNTNTRLIEAKLAEMERAQEQAHERLKQIREEMKEILTPEQRARYLLTEERLSQEMVHALKRKMEERAGSGPGSHFWRREKVDR